MAENNPFENAEGPSARKVPAAGAENPFQAPAAHVDDVRDLGDGSLLDEPNRLGAGRGSSWWGNGWSLFREATGLWIGIGVFMLVMNLIFNVIPFIGAVANALLSPVFTAGLMLGCQSLERGDGLRFEHVFSGFQKNFGQLVLAGLLIFVAIFVVVIVIIVAVLIGGFSVGFNPSSISGALLAVAVLAGILLGIAIIPLAWIVWFTPALIVLNELTATEALKQAFRGIWRNILPILVFSLLGLLLAIVAMIPLGLGLLVLIPTMFCAAYSAYREIFVNQEQ